MHPSNSPCSLPSVVGCLSQCSPRSTSTAVFSSVGLEGRRKLVPCMHFSLLLILLDLLLLVARLLCRGSGSVTSGQSPALSEQRAVSGGQTPERRGDWDCQEISHSSHSETQNTFTERLLGHIQRKGTYFYQFTVLFSWEITNYNTFKTDRKYWECWQIV